jgi:hypothetical protein
MIGSDLFTDDLDQHLLPPPAVELPIKDPLPRAKVQPAVCHRDHRCASRPMTCKVQPVFAARFRWASALSLPVQLRWY